MRKASAPTVKVKKTFGPPVPGELVKLEGLNLTFGHSGRRSPYDELLEKLRGQEETAALKFAETRCRTSIAVRAKKLGIKVMFAELDGCLYVRIDPTARVSNLERVMQALREGPKNEFEVATWVRAHGNETIDANITRGLLHQLAKTGKAFETAGRYAPVNGRGGAK